MQAEQGGFSSSSNGASSGLYTDYKVGFSESCFSYVDGDIIITCDHAGLITDIAPTYAV